MSLGGGPIDVYVLTTADPVISLRSAVKAVTGQDAINLGEYLSISGLKEFANKDLFLGETFDFHIPGTQFRGRGIPAQQFEAILSGYVRAHGAGALKTDRQKETATACAIFSTAFLRIGIVAQIDEATGYQYERAQDALQIKLKAYIADEVRPRKNGACTNQAASYFSSLRRAEIGQDHHVSGRYLAAHAVRWRGARIAVARSMAFCTRPLRMLRWRIRCRGCRRVTGSGDFSSCFRVTHQ